jgi:glycosyltransferase involved in cell wall biosynthesis
MKIAWVSTWDRVCGIADYSKELWPAVEKNLRERGDEGFVVSLDPYPTTKDLVEKLREIAPDLIHFQHEYGFFGGKNPPFYRFPFLVEDIKKTLPQTKIVATAHTVIPEKYKFPLKGRGWQIPLREFANQFLLTRLQREWGPKTWGAIDGTIIHSKLQIEIVKNAGSPFVEVVPHFIPAREKVLSQNESNAKTLLVFGFFTPEKGQDILIDAFKFLSDLPQLRVIFAGGARRAQDKAYLKICEKKIRKLGLGDRVTVTGYVGSQDLQKYFQAADLVVAPFRETTGSGSIAQVLARGLPVIASDLPLNREINEREKGALEFFKSENPEDLAKKIREVVYNRERLQLLRQGALRYANALSPSRIAFQHLLIYDKLLV